MRGRISASCYPHAAEHREFDPASEIELNSGDRSDTEVCGQQTSLQHRVTVYGRAPAVPDGQ